MEDRRSTSVRTKLGVLVVSAALLSGMVLAFGPSAGAVNVPGGTLGSFENDGNQAVDADGNLDWANAEADPRIDQFIAVHDDGDGDLTDSSSISGKEQDPSGWTCQETESPPKDDIFRAYIATQLELDAQFLHLAFVRGKNTGDTDLNFEFNRSSLGFPCATDPDAAGANRSPGDLLVSFSFPGNAGDPAVIDLFKWVEPAPVGASDDFTAADGAWVDQDLSADAARAEDNTASVADALFGGGAIDSRDFGEATIDLSAALDGSVLSCPGFGFVNVHSRASHSFASDLKDVFPQTPIDLSTCGSIKIKKVDDAGNLLDGATFGVFDSAETAATHNAAQAVATCVTGELSGDADQGLCTFGNLEPGDYWVAELSAPDGYGRDDTVVGPITLGLTEDVDLTGQPFVDPLNTGSVLVTKAVTSGDEDFDVDPAELNGLTFLLERDGQPVTTWPGGDPAACSLDGVSLSCEIGPVPLGDYVLTEDPTTLPPGMAQGSDVEVTIDEDDETVDATITNPLEEIDISIVKDGPDLAHRGDEITYTFAVTNTGVVALVAVELTDPRCDDGTLMLVDDGDGDGTLDVDEQWTYECSRVITAADPDPLPNTATVTGTDARGRTAEAQDGHEVDLIAPAIEVVKTVDDGSPSVGQTITFTYVVTNIGDTTLVDVTVVDDQLGPIGSIDELEPGHQATLTKTMVVAADSPTENIAVASGTDALGRTVTDDDDATIAIVLGVVLVRPAPLPVTGLDLWPLLVDAVALILLGGAIVALGTKVPPARHATGRRS